MHEIRPYLDSCADYYRPLAELLIGSGLRISEALALRFGHLDLQHGVIRVYGQRDREGEQTKATKGKRFRSVQIGPSLAESLREQRRDRNAGDDWLFLCPPPKRGRYSGRTEPVPPSRKTVHDWHEAALQDAGLRDMPLHALRHTAAAAWLATGHPLIFVQRQLGHRSITTTEEHYGHLELSFVQEAVQRTEDAIAAATPRDDQPEPSDGNRS
jgi:integrase